MRDPRIPQTTAGGLLADVDQVALVRALIAHAHAVGAEHHTYAITGPDGRPYGAIEHTWTATDGTRVIVHDGWLIWQRGVSNLLTARVDNAYQVADLLTAVGVIPQHAGVCPIVRAAIAALDAYGLELTVGPASDLLHIWSRRGQLTTADVEQIIAHYPPDVDPSGIDYDRSDTAPAVAPVPAHVDGWPINSRGGVQ